MRCSSSFKLAWACYGAFFFLTSPVALVNGAKKVQRDKRTGADFGSDSNCVDAYNRKVRYLQIEMFDYNKEPYMEMTWRQTTDECGIPITDGFSETAYYDYEVDGANLSGGRVQLDMYICAPWGNYELDITSRSLNNGFGSRQIAWEIEYGPEEYHIWDVLNTPLNSDSNYAPVPSSFRKGDPDGDSYTWPLEGSEGYYSVMYSGPFPPLQCPNLYPEGVDYVGCFTAGMFGTAEGPSGSLNPADPAEPYRMFDGIDDDGIDADEKVMTLQKCKDKCTLQNTAYFGLESGMKCLCGNTLVGVPYDDKFGEGGSVCGIDYTTDENIPEYRFLCTGDSRHLCGTDTHISVYEITDRTGTPGPTPSPVVVETPSPVAVVDGKYEADSCRVDLKGSKVMTSGAHRFTPMSAEACYAFCAIELPTFKYFGTEWSKECWCTETLAASAVSPDCTTPCAGNTDEICGGTDAISVYKLGSDPVDPPTPSPTDPAVPTPSPTDPAVPTPSPTVGGSFTYSGCWQDDGDNRIMGERDVIVPKTGSMSAEICFGICNNGINTHFGTQWGRECFCVVDPGLSVIGLVPPLDDTEHCLTTCRGTPGSETCGGTDEMSVYAIL